VASTPAIAIFSKPKRETAPDEEEDPVASDTPEGSVEPAAKLAMKRKERKDICAQRWEKNTHGDKERVPPHLLAATEAPVSAALEDAVEAMFLDFMNRASPQPVQ
jgi:hypothetical protein